MKFILALFALCAFVVAEDAAIRLDLGSIVGTTINDPKACRRGELCMQLVGIAGEGFNLRRGKNIFKDVLNNNGAGAASVHSRATAAANPAAIDATTADSNTLTQVAIPTAMLSAKNLADVPIINAFKAGNTNLQLSTSKNIDTRTGAFDSSALRGDAPGATTTAFTLGRWLSATASGLIRCQNVKPYAVIELWFENLVPQGLYSMHFVYNTAAVAGGNQFTKGLNANNQPLAGSASYFVANGDGKAYIQRILPGSTTTSSCFFLKDGAASTAKVDQPTAIDVRFHSNGVVLGAIPEVPSLNFNPAVGTAQDFFIAASVAVAGATPLLAYGQGSHSHVTISYPDLPLTATSDTRYNIQHNTIAVDAAFIL
jgi:hypothetical protein